MPTKPQKVYLGDSVYANFDGFAIVLTTENGEPGELASNTIYMEPNVLEALVPYLKQVEEYVKYCHAKQNQT